MQFDIIGLLELKSPLPQTLMAFKVSTKESAINLMKCDLIVLLNFSHSDISLWF